MLSAGLARIKAVRSQPVIGTRGFDRSTSANQTEAATLERLMEPSGQSLFAYLPLADSRTDMRRWKGARPTPVLDTLWRFCSERQAIYLRRLRGLRPPWTSDHTLQRYRFTNVFRASDRVSQFLIRSVIYDQETNRSAENTFFRIILFKLFNRIETWRHLEREFGPPEWSTYRFERYEQSLSRLMSTGGPVYSAAYIMPSPGFDPSARKFVNHLRLLESMMEDRLPKRMAKIQSMEGVFDLLCSYRGIGPFLAYQYAIDLNYSELLDLEESDFVVAGPGARNGLSKCFSDPGLLSESDLIRLLHDKQEEELERRGLSSVDLWGRPLQLIDCQNVLCEVDKYSRVAHPSIHGRVTRRRIKQLYRFTEELIAPWFPPKWGLNERVMEWARRHACV